MIIKIKKPIMSQITVLNICHRELFRFNRYLIFKIIKKNIDYNDFQTLRKKCIISKVVEIIDIETISFNLNNN